MLNPIPEIVGVPAQCDCTDPHTRVNASQIKTWQDCPRKWAFDSLLAPIEGAKRGSAATELGTRVHKIAENFYTKDFTVDWTDAQAARIFMPALGHIPEDKKHAYHVEEHVRVGQLWHGTIDMWYLDEEGTPTIYDWKSTGNLEWAKTPQDLLEDPQAMLYAAALLELTGTEWCDLNWIYLTTKGTPRCEPRRVSVTSQHAFGFLESLRQTAEELLFERGRYPKVDRQHNLDHINSVEANTGSCRKYGGCPHNSYCNEVERNPFVSLQRFEERAKKMGILDNLKSVPVAINPPESKPVDKALWVKRGAEDTILGIQDLMKGVDEAYEVLVLTAPRGWFANYGLEESAPETISPPEEVLEQVEAQYPELSAKAEAQGTKRRGRPPGSKKKAAQDTEANEVVETFPIEEEPGAKETCFEGLLKGTPCISALYLDCHPNDIDVNVYSEMVQNARKLVAETFNVADYRFIEYGKGNGALVQAFTQILDETCPSELYVDTRMTETSLVLSLLISRSHRIVQ